MEGTAVVLNEPSLDRGFADEVAAYPGGERVLNCQQCGVCTGSCPLSSAMKYTPRRLMQMIRTGMRAEALAADTFWYCASCYSCSVRCPQDINLAEVMYAMRNLALKGSRDASAAFYRAFAESVRRHGRAHEVEMMLLFAFGSNPLRLLKMAPIGLKMMLKGKMHFLQSSIKGVREVQQLYRAAAAVESGKGAVQS